jgi:hypothetical protein
VRAAVGVSEAEAVPATPASRICMSVFDHETCAACAAWHGVEFDVEDGVVELPNVHCTCPLGCRCFWVDADAAVAKDE